MSKKKNRKKVLKLQMKRQGLLKSQPAVPMTSAPAQNSASKQATAPKSTSSKVVTTSLEDFAASKEVADVRANLVETLYEAGIHSAADFANWTEKDLLALKGIGPATVKKLQENGVSFKA
ncbi:helix-hairpin-helix domain-containing protein [Streptococcus dentasini]